MGRRVGRVIEAPFRAARDIVDPSHNMNKLYNEKKKEDMRAMAEMERREKEALEVAKGEQKYQDKLAQDKRLVESQEDIIKEQKEGNGSLKTGGNDLTGAIRISKMINEANKQNNKVMDDDEERKLLEAYLKK